MKTFPLSATVRSASEMGKKASKMMRKSRLVPAVLYGGAETVHIAVKLDDIRDLVYTPEIYLVELDRDGVKCHAIMQDIQFHPVTDRILHIDFLEVSKNKPIVMSVPVALEGYAAGVKAGGKLTQDKRNVRVRAFFTDMPERLTIDVTKLKLGKTIQIRDLSFPGLELIDAPNMVVCSVRLTRAAAGFSDEEDEEVEGEATEEGGEATEQAEATE